MYFLTKTKRSERCTVVNIAVKKKKTAEMICEKTIIWTSS